MRRTPLSSNILEIENLALTFDGRTRKIHALRGVGLTLAQGEILALVGESGSGKSVTGLSILKLHGTNANLSGRINYAGKNLVELSDDAMRSVRGREIAMIFQEPMTALNPVFTVGFQIREVIELHAGLKRKAADKFAESLLESVGIPEPALRLKSYPFQLSGGMRQRILIAMALAAKPKILIADEPTTALDVTIQAQILTLLREINEQEKMSMIFITHDLGIVAKLAHRVAVMYAGEVVETGSVAEIFDSPAHPYTRALLASVSDVKRGQKLQAISGAPPQLTENIQGCAFEPRCAVRESRCTLTIPLQQKQERRSRCVHAIG